MSLIILNFQLTLPVVLTCIFLIIQGSFFHRFFLRYNSIIVFILVILFNKLYF
jgi:hypothetical protein